VPRQLDEALAFGGAVGLPAACADRDVARDVVGMGRGDDMTPGIEGGPLTLS